MLQQLKLILLSGFYIAFFCLQVNAQTAKNVFYTPVIEGGWWDITKNPDLGEYTSLKQQPVDFAIWQAADGTIQLWSCIRGIKKPGYSRLLYRWETKNITDKNWTPQGIAMESDTTLGEANNGLQAPFVIKESGKFFMFYGDWNRICLAQSLDGKKFERVLSNNSPALFSGPLTNTRDPMVLNIDGTFYCYYTAHVDKSDLPAAIPSAVYCRTSKDFKNWSRPIMVGAGGRADKQTDWYGGGAECPFVVKVKAQYVLFRNQVYGPKNLNTQYCSSDPLNFGIDDDRYYTGSLNVAAPEIIKIKNQYYIIALKPGLDGMRVAKLKFVKTKLK